MKNTSIFLTAVLSCALAMSVHALPNAHRSHLGALKNGDEISAKEALVGFQTLPFPVNLLAINNGSEINLRHKFTAEEEAVLTRAMLAQLIYNAETAFNDTQLSYEDLAGLVARLQDCMPRLAASSEMTDVDYAHPHDAAIHYAIANGFMVPQDATSFGADAAASCEEFDAAIIRMSKRLEKPSESLVPTMKRLLAENRSGLARLAATNLYKKASCALAHPLFPKAEKAAIRALLDEIKNNARKMSPVTGVVGSPADPNTYIYKLDSGLHVNELTIASRKPETDPVEIVLFADTHFNAFNAKDEAEQNPSLMSTRQYRTWLANGASASCVNRLMDFARYSDQTVVAGDVLDFLSCGAQQLTVETLFRKDVSLLACLGGHDVTRVMQGKVPDPTSLESRRKVLADFWINDITYDSRVIKDKVMVVVMDNGMGQFYLSQIGKLKADIERARANNWIVLIAVHEPLCTRNPAHKDTQPFMKGDPDIDTNFFDHKCCRPGHKEASDAIFDLIVSNADVVRGVFNGHEHNAYYTSFNGTYTDESGKKAEKSIPQHTVTCCIYRSGCLALITVK